MKSFKEIFDFIKDFTRLRKLKIAKPATFIICIISCGFGILSVAQAKDKPVEEAFLGAANAPISLIEYGSLSCSHCADFANNVFPLIKTNYIDTGKVKYIFRAFPTPPPQLSYSLQIIADCAGGANRYKLIEKFFEQQGQIFKAAQSNGGAIRLAIMIAKYEAGLSEKDATSCLKDNGRIDYINKVSDYAAAKYKISQTPTLMINSKVINHPIGKPYDYEMLSLAIDAALVNHKKLLIGKKP